MIANVLLLPADTVVVLPMKDPRCSKRRLRCLPDGNARARLAYDCFARTIRFFTHHFAQLTTVVVSDSTRILRDARSAGVVALDDGGIGLNGAIRCAQSWCVTHGVARLLVVPTDLLSLHSFDIFTMLRLSQRYDVVICASDDGGTNMLALTPPDVIAPCFGRCSARRHLAAAAAIGKTGYVLRRRRCADLDTPRDAVRAGIVTAMR